MYFEGVGTLPCDPPPPELKPFFRRKFVTVFRGFTKFGDGWLRRNDFTAWTDRASNSITDLDKKREFVTRHMKIYDDYILFGRQRINEQQYISELMNLAFADARSRKLHMTAWKKFVPDYFMLGDTNKDGYIDNKEFRAIAETFNLPFHETEIVFDAINVAKDGLISMEEYGFALISYYFYSGPNDPISLLHGELVATL